MKSHWATHSGADLRPATAEEIEGKGPIPVSPSMQYIDEETKLWVRWGFFWACEDCVTPFDGVWDEDAQRRFKEADQEIRTRIEQLGHQHETPHYESYENFFASSKNERVAESTEAGRGLSQVAGMTNLKEQLMHEVIGPFKDPELYRRYRVSLPNGILFFGPPGCGKTYIARALADELGWHFQYCRPSDVASPYIHDTVSKIRAVFSTAIEKAPAIVFIDEFEAFVPARSELGGHQQYKAEEVNEFLANLEGCAERKVLVIAATNEPEKIDPAVRRSGRFDKLILVPLPDAEARQAMLELHLQDRPVDGSVDMAGISAALEGYSASDIKLLVDEAARIALKRKELIQTGTLLAALERVPSSITAEDMQRYDGFRSRGTG
jgi:transitional endoplasmic reticulum ATPase